MEHLTLKLTPQGMERYCRQTRRSARDTATALAALVAVQTFLAAQVDAEDGLYRNIRDVLSEHVDALQARLLEESGAAIAAALRGADSGALARAAGPLSRSGFATALEHAWRALGPAERATAAAWVRRWCADARRRGDAASGYPDAPDFQAAGIDLREYAALADIERLLPELDAC